jgi:hypothetical protein
MKTYIHPQGFKIWQSIVYGYNEPAVSPTSERVIKLSQNNSKATNSLLNGLGELVYTKVMHCKSAKEIWDKLQSIYERDSKFKEVKLQTYRGHFEQLKMKDDAGASPTHQVSQRGSRKTVGQASTNFENTLVLLRKSLMKPFMKAHFVYCNGP